MSIAITNGKHKLMKTQLGSITKTGERCPASGLWKVLENPSIEIQVYEGNLIPPYKGRSVSWELRAEID